MHTAAKLWKGRDPQILLTQIRSYIPRGSIVLGPAGGEYFFPVEQSGSRYLYFYNDVTPGLSLGDYTEAYRERALDAATCTAPTFAVWPRGQANNSLPEEIARHGRIELNSEDVSGSDAPVIYRLAVPGSCSSIQFDVSSIKPFGQP